MRKSHFLITLILVLFFSFIYNYSFTIKASTPPEYSSNYSIHSSFIQSWYCKDFNYDRWVKELSALKDLGLEEVIVQTVIDTRRDFTIYPTNLEGYSTPVNDSLKFLFEAAEDTGMKVRLGLGDCGEWWRKLGFDSSWLIDEANMNIKITNELIDKYGHYESLSGWYIPYEIYQFSALTNKHRDNLNKFFKDISNNIKEKSSLSIMISPFYKADLSFAISLNTWTSFLEDVLKDTGIDILALQDSIGAGFNNLDNIANVFLHTKNATDKLGIKLYGNVETFKKGDSGFVPQKESHIIEQMEKVMPYVDGFIAFSINHYQLSIE